MERKATAAHPLLGQSQFESVCSGSEQLILYSHLNASFEMSEDKSTRHSSQTTFSRRQAICAGCALGSSIVGATSAIADTEKPAKGISEIRMKSARLDELQRFYEDSLELPVTLKDDSLTVVAGTTRLVFSQTQPSENEPFYHFAFNIPENNIDSAKQWQKKRTPLLRRGNKEVIHFKGINAHSVYFNDPAGNIVEYIARHELENAADKKFGPQQILYASEIGLVVDDVGQTQREIKETLGLSGLPGSFRSASFSPVGDAHALLILVKRNRKWFPNNQQAAQVHPVDATIRGARAGQLVNSELDYSVHLTPEEHG